MADTLREHLAGTPLLDLERLSIFSGVPLGILYEIDEGSVIPDPEIMDVLVAYVPEIESFVKKDLDDYAALDSWQRRQAPDGTRLVMVTADQIEEDDWFPVEGMRGWCPISKIDDSPKTRVHFWLPLKDGYTYKVTVAKNRRLKVARNVQR